MEHTKRNSPPAEQPFAARMPDMPLRITAERALTNVYEKRRLHYHDCLEIGCCLSGSGIYYIRNEIYPFNRGDIAVIYPGEIHDGCCITPGSSEWRFIFWDPAALFADLPDREHLMTLTDALLYRGRLCSPAERNRIQPLLQRIFELYDSAGQLPDKPAYVTLLLAGILYETEQFLPKMDKTMPLVTDDIHRIVSPAVTHMMNHYATPVRMEDLSALCYVSEGHLRRVFTAVFGVPPMTFLHKIRIRHACAALDGTDDSILSIAERCGYTSLSSFNRQFQKFMHITPLEYRKKFRDWQVSG